MDAKYVKLVNWQSSKPRSPLLDESDKARARSEDGLPLTAIDPLYVKQVLRHMRIELSGSSYGIATDKPQTFPIDRDKYAFLKTDEIPDMVMRITRTKMKTSDKFIYYLRLSERSNGNGMGKECHIADIPIYSPEREKKLRK